MPAQSQPPLFPRASLRTAAFLLTTFLVAFSRPASAQEVVELGSTAFLDYFHELSTFEGNEAGIHGFTYRRLYLTADFDLSERYSARARLEANDGTTGAKGPVPFVKDLYVRRTSASGHVVTAGVAPPPVFEIVEDVWDYRSLRKTALDLYGVVSSRDFGVRLHGPITADRRLRYGVMYANNSASRPEVDDGKRIYGQLLFVPTEALVLAVGSNYAGHDDARDRQLVVSGFGGYATERWRLGVEAFWSRTAFASDLPSGTRTLGASLFGIVEVAERWELVGRLDRVGFDLPETETTVVHALAGVSYRLQEHLRLIPNVLYTGNDDLDGSEVTARLTLELDI